MNEQLKEARNRLADLFMQVDADVSEDCRTKDLIEAMQDAKSFLDGEAAEEDTEAFDRSFPELSNAAAGLMALKAMQQADFGNQIADMLYGKLNKGEK